VEGASFGAKLVSTLNLICMLALEEDGGEGRAIAALGSGERHSLRIRQALRGVLILEEAWPWQRRRSW
jgi:hypothetical protein